MKLPTILALITLFTVAGIMITVPAPVPAAPAFIPVNSLRGVPLLPPPSWWDRYFPDFQKVPDCTPKFYLLRWQHVARCPNFT